MVSANIKVFIRIRPSARPSKGFAFDAESGALNYDLEKRSSEGQVDNSKTTFKFRFDGILPMQVTQKDVFERVAKPVIDDVLRGINGTIFAYGQTGSGKTFTITGGAERYDDRGLIPRTISYLFDQFKRSDGCKYSLYVSYLEIYNNDGYDLLSRDDAAKMEDLPKVQLREDGEGNIKLRNLSVNVAQKEEDALNLLFLGDTNRVVAETPMNDASTRSHCLFIIWVESSQAGSDTVKRSKLHLVDLAGSERIGKTGVEGKLRTEATSINLSLHYLEQVIVALHDRSQGRQQHIPYRNSILTSVLRDSLGGNCKTLMVGTVAIEESNLEESISTCRFAQRVAAIKNNAIVNEELDPALMIRRLKKEVAQLKDELAMLNGGEDEELNQAALDECRSLVTRYLEETDSEAVFVCGSMARFRKCFELLRQVYWDRQSDGSIPASSTSALDGDGPALGTTAAAVVELRQQVARRDEEIGLLLSSIHKRSGNVGMDGPVFIQAAPRTQAAGESGAAASAQQSAAESAALLLDRNKAFEEFRKSVRRREGLQETQAEHAKLVEEARQCGLAANAAREVVNNRKVRIEKLRMERAMANNPRDQGSDSSTLDGPEVAALVHEMEEQKRIYHQNTSRLREVRSQIENFKGAKQQSEERMRKDFEAWFNSVCASQQASGQEGPGPQASASQQQQQHHQLQPSSPGPSGSPLDSPGMSQSRSFRSEADSSARATPVGTRPSPPATRRSSDRLSGRPPQVTSWTGATIPETGQSQPMSPAPYTSKLSTAATPPAAASPPAAAVASAAASAASASAPASANASGALPAALPTTGHQETDADIAAYYAALAALGS